MLIAAFPPNDVARRRVSLANGETLDISAFRVRPPEKLTRFMLLHLFLRHYVHVTVTKLLFISKLVQVGRLRKVDIWNDV